MNMVKSFLIRQKKSATDTLKTVWKRSIQKQKKQVVI